MRDRKVRILIVAGVDRTIVKFRLNLIQELEKQFNAEIHVACEDTGFRSDLVGAGVVLFPLKVSRKNPLAVRNLISIFKLGKFIRQEKFDIVHTNTPIGGFIGRVASCWWKEAYVFHTTGGFYFQNEGKGFIRYLFVQAERFLARLTDTIFSVNREDIRLANSLNIKPKKSIVFTGGAGVDLDIFDPSSEHVQKAAMDLLKELGLPSSKKIVLFVGRLTSEKGIDRFIRVVLELGQSVDFVALVVGDTRTAAKGILEKIELARNEVDIRLLGYRSDLTGIYSISDILIFPSLREGMPVSPLEAMAMKVPVVAHNIRGCREEIQPGVNGYLCDVGDHACLVSYSRELLTDSKKKLDMGLKCRRFVGREFSRSIIVGRQLEIYKNALEQNNSV